MRRIILLFALMIMCGITSATAQVSLPEDEQTAPTPDIQGVERVLTQFDKVLIDGAMDVTMIKIADTESPRIVYDTKGAYNTRFESNISNLELEIKERIDPRRTTRTQVVIYYTDIHRLIVDRAAVVVHSPIEGLMVDVECKGGAKLSTQIMAQDARISADGGSLLTLSGELKFADMAISNSEIDGGELTVNSLEVLSTSSAKVRITVGERIIAATNTNGIIDYLGKPTIVRTSSKFMGGDISHLAK